MPYEEYKKQEYEKHRQTGRGFYKKQQPPPEKKMDFESVLHWFMEASEKRHDTTGANLRNHLASINNIKTQLWKLTTLVNERLPYFQFFSY